MAQRIRLVDVDLVLADAGHRYSEFVTDDSTGESDWDPGYRCVQHGPRAVLVFHDGPGQHDGIGAYTTALRAAGYHVIPDKPQASRVRLIITRP